MNCEEIKLKIKSGMNRFLGEMPPYWDKESLRKLVLPLELGDKPVEEAFKALNDEGLIYLVKDDNHYFIISEKFVKDTVGADSVLGSFRLKQIEHLKKAFEIL